MALKRARSWGLRLPSALMRPSAPLICACSLCSRLASLGVNCPEARPWWIRSRLAVLTPVYPMTCGAPVYPSLPGDRLDRLVVDFGVPE